MQRNSVFLIAGALAAVLFASVGLGIAETGTRYVDVTFGLASPITLHEPIVIDVTIKNQMPYAISFDLGLRHKSAYHFSVVTPYHRVLDLPFPFENGSWGPTYLNIGEQYYQRLLLNEWCPFDDPGDYRMVVKLELPIVRGRWKSPAITSEDESGHQVEAAIFTIKILPRNGIALKQKCDALMSKLQAGHEFPDRTPFAEELSYVKDPIAIPYLVQLVQEREELPAIEGLKRIGTDEAWEAMIVVTKSKFNEASAAYAKAILRQKISEIRNPDIRKKVEAAVK